MSHLPDCRAVQAKAQRAGGEGGHLSQMWMYPEPKLIWERFSSLATGRFDGEHGTKHKKNDEKHSHFVPNQEDVVKRTENLQIKLLSTKKGLRESA